ncbi:restriction endonuclease [Phnomibacter sp. MR]|uniref:restriction endonuclease n=1 Tax=Phnomibacter sp. MR TaxID=3042318 RepID=UPI003A80556B
MNPKQFEELICEHYRQKGYEANTTSYSNDYGVDVFATKGKEKIAVQAKMYGSGTRKINRQMVMELHGAKDYFDCTKAVIATDGVLLPDAIEVARKLKIEILSIDASTVLTKTKKTSNDRTFEGIWEKYIIPLQGKTLTRDSGETNQIMKVNWSEVERITSNGNNGKIKVEIFKQAINKLLTDGSITRDYINKNYVGRASSGVILILSQVPFFQLTDRPTGLKYIK